MAQFRHLVKMAALVAAIFLVAALAPATAQDKRSGVGPCRQGALSLIGMLDLGEDNTADYRHAYDGVVQTCGPAGMPSAQPPSARADCPKLARAMLDAIEEGKINTQAFVHTRTRFALSCAPR